MVTISQELCFFKSPNAFGSCIYLHFFIYLIDKKIFASTKCELNLHRLTSFMLDDIFKFISQYQFIFIEPSSKYSVFSFYQNAMQTNWILSLNSIQHFCKNEVFLSIRFCFFIFLPPFKVAKILSKMASCAFSISFYKILISLSQL